MQALKWFSDNDKRSLIKFIPETKYQNFRHFIYMDIIIDRAFLECHKCFGQIDKNVYSFCKIPNGINLSSPYYINPINWDKRPP